MSPILHKVTKDALNMSDEERASLAHTLIQSLDTQYDADREKMWDDEVQKRVDRIDSGDASGRDAQDLFKDIDSKLS